MSLLIILARVVVEKWRKTIILDLKLNQEPPSYVYIICILEGSGAGFPPTSMEYIPNNAIDAAFNSLSLCMHDA